MASFNRVLLVGFLGRGPELRQGQSGSFTNFSLATDESYTSRDGASVKRTEWHRIVVYGKQAENCAKYLKKGSQCLVEGSLQTRKWTDQEGIEKSVTEIKASRVQFLDRKEQDSNQSQSTPSRTAPGNEQSWDEVPF